VRLNRFLAGAGLGSRRSCEELIRQGRVDVNGVTADFPGPEIDPGHDVVRCDGSRLHQPRRFLYMMMYKPAGYVTTRSDELGRKTVDQLLGRLQGRVFAVGRLDRASEGLLLFTNNGELANRLLHPRHRIERTYLTWVRPAPSPDAIQRIKEGVSIGPGEWTGPAQVRILGKRSDATRVRITLREGRFREVRRLFAALGMQVLALRRISFAGLSLVDLSVGAVRPLTTDEVATLSERTGLQL
jgi:23S rRNA pseudouridine2605 synthase